MKLAIVLLTAVLLLSCVLSYVTFEEVSAPYMEEYGEPEKVEYYEYEEFEAISWIWFSQGFQVIFINFKNGGGWYVDVTFSWEML